jgi:integrase/recombinase XerD
MPAKLSTTVNKIQLIPNSRNAGTISEFYSYMKKSGASQNHQNNSIKVVIAFAKFLGSDLTFYDIKRKEQITAFLDTKLKDLDEDPEMKWITTWNHYLHRIKLFFRWLHNCTSKEPDSETNPSSEWETPARKNWPKKG